MADLIGPFVKSLNGTIIECNTAYPGARTNAADHYKVAEKHGFTSFADVDIMDAEGEFKIPFEKGKHLKYDIVGKNFARSSVCSGYPSVEKGHKAELNHVSNTSSSW